VTNPYISGAVIQKITLREPSVARMASAAGAHAAGVGSSLLTRAHAVSPGFASKLLFFLMMKYHLGWVVFFLEDHAQILGKHYITMRRIISKPSFHGQR
jgi:hypothetical protein